MELTIKEMQMLEIQNIVVNIEAKHRVCYSLHPELLILHLTKGKL